jgi:hypothetical protein
MPTPASRRVWEGKARHYNREIAVAPSKYVLVAKQSHEGATISRRTRAPEE